MLPDLGMGVQNFAHERQAGGDKIRLTVDDVLALAWEDDGKIPSPVPRQSGWLDLRQMGHMELCEYGHVKVYRLKP